MDQSVSDLQNLFPNLSEEEIADTIFNIQGDDMFTLGGITIDYDTPLTVEPSVIEHLENLDTINSNPPGAGIDGFEFNNTEKEGWEVEAFGITMNDRDDVFTVGAVFLLAVIFYVLKVSIDHWFNKRLEKYKKTLK